MSDRLLELQRQRALIQSHLAWLDQEIASAAGKSGAREDSPTPTIKSRGAAVSPDTAVEPLGDELIAKFGDESKGTVQDARKGCFLVFTLVMIVLGLGVYGLILFSRNLHAHDAPPAKRSAPGSP